MCLMRKSAFNTLYPNPAMDTSTRFGHRRSKGGAAAAIAVVCCCRALLLVLSAICDDVSLISSSRLTFFHWHPRLRPGRSSLVRSRGTSPAVGGAGARGLEADPDIVIKEKRRDGEAKKGDEEVCVISWKDGELVEECRDITPSQKTTGVKSLLQNYDDMDPYKVLGVSFTAKHQQIKAAYMEICKKQHPDLNGGYESPEFQQASRAYRILSKERAKYNVTSGAQKVASLAGGFFDMAFAVAAAGVTAMSAAANKRNESASKDGTGA
eukprot:TRINITY_DN58303_c0_g1_i1.p1 TRINITY_DN58303_c0_g1~~TRINITY_DN58303_c0_g1_i1.p1  ORF type:complete len:267 (-),score=41.72 TRINITY_DN58303_c0_g1_i1:277-1077(-)